MAKINLKRQLFHLSLGFFLFFVLLATNSEFVKFILIFPIIFGLYVIKKVKEGELKLFKEIGSYFMDESKSKIGGGALFFLLGVFFTLSLFSKRDSAISILVLTIPDCLAALIGYNFGKIEIYNGKSLLGTLTFFFSSSLILLIFEPFLVSIAIGGVASITELFSKEIIDDNFLIPLIVGFFLTLF